MVVTVLPMAWRWQQLLAGRGIHDRLPWLTRAYFTAYTAGQVLPTSIGGDAMRIFETSRRHPGQGGPIAGSVLLERALGGAATLALAAVGFVLAIGRYDVGAYLWVELGFVVATVFLGVVLFSRRMRRPLRGHRAAAAAAPRRAAAARGLRGNPRLPGAPVAAGRRVRAHALRAGGARAGDLAGGEVGRRRPVAARLLRDGAAALPRHARALHDQRARRPRSVLRLVPRQARTSARTRRSRPAFSSSSSRSRCRCLGR